MKDLFLNKKVLFLLVVLFSAAVSLTANGQKEPEMTAPGNKMKESAMMVDSNWETAVFAGGCFWGVEGVFESLKGVKDVVSGYSGGNAETATYNQVGTGKTGHAESVEIKFDPGLISFETLLDVFFTVAHDPTQLNYQGPDVGTEYRSVVFYTSESQKATTLSYIEKLNSMMVLNSTVVTQVVPLEAFYPAEDYHQDFMKINPTHPYIVYWDLPKLDELKRKFPDLVKMN